MRRGGRPPPLFGDGLRGFACACCGVASANSTTTGRDWPRKRQSRLRQREVVVRRNGTQPQVQRDGDAARDERDVERENGLDPHAAPTIGGSADGAGSPPQAARFHTGSRASAATRFFPATFAE